MKLAASVAFICTGLFFAASGFPQAQKPAPGVAKGTWSGQATGSKSYSVTVWMDGSGKGYVEYPSLKCGGRLTFVKKNADTSSYRETITHGQAKCGAAGQIDLTPDGEQMGWARTAGSNHSNATLTLVAEPGPNQCAACELHYDQSYQACYRNSNMDDRQKCQDTAEDDLRACEGACKQ